MALGVLDADFVNDKNNDMDGFGPIPTQIPAAGIAITVSKIIPLGKYHGETFKCYIIYLYLY